MEDSNSNKNPLGDLFSSVKHYMDLRIDEIKLVLAENLAKIFSRIIFFFLIFILIGIILGIFAVILSVWMESVTGNKIYGLLIAAVIFVIATIILYFCRNRFLINSPLRMFVKMFFDNKDNGKEQ